MEFIDYEELAIKLFKEHGAGGITPQVLLDAIGVDYEEEKYGTCIYRGVDSHWSIFDVTGGVEVYIRQSDIAERDRVCHYFFAIGNPLNVQIVLEYLSPIANSQEIFISDIARRLVKEYGIDGIDTEILLDSIGVKYEVGNFEICQWSKGENAYLLTRYYGPDRCIEFESHGEESFDEVIEMETIQDVYYALRCILKRGRGGVSRIYL